MGGFGVILMPKKISTTTTLDYFEIYVTLLKNMVQNFKKIHNDFKTWYKTSEISQNFKTGYREKVHLFVEKK